MLSWASLLITCCCTTFISRFYSDILRLREVTWNPKVTQFRNYRAGLEFRTSHNLPLFLLYMDDIRSPQDQTVLCTYLGDLTGILISKWIFSLGCCHPSPNWRRSYEKHGENENASLEHVRILQLKPSYPMRKGNFPMVPLSFSPWSYWLLYTWRHTPKGPGLE